MREIKRRIIEILDAQEQKGIATYGHTLEDARPQDWNWDRMALEELIDALQYQIKQNLLLEDDLVRATQVISELEYDLDKCDGTVRELLYKNRDSSEY
jgi:hypothetical protein